MAESLFWQRRSYKEGFAKLSNAAAELAELLGGTDPLHKRRYREIAKVAMELNQLTVKVCKWAEEQCKLAPDEEEWHDLLLRLGMKCNADEEIPF